MRTRSRRPRGPSRTATSTSLLNGLLLSHTKCSRSRFAKVNSRANPSTYYLPLLLWLKYQRRSVISQGKAHGLLYQLACWMCGANMATFGRHESSNGPKTNGANGVWLGGLPFSQHQMCVIQIRHLWSLFEISILVSPGSLPPQS